MYTHLGDLISL